MSRLPARKPTGESSSNPARPRLSAAARISLRRRRVNIVRVEPDLVVDFPLLENVVGFRERLEFLFRRFVPRVYVRMVFASQFAERLANVVRRSRLFYAEDVVVVFGLRGHG